MISPSLDHLPFMLGGADVSFTIEQQIPLSGIRRSRRTAALAGVDRLRAEANRATLDVGIEAANAFLMLQERRRTQALVAEQIGFARDVVNAANARYSSGTAPQSDVLRAEVEVARLGALSRALVEAKFLCVKSDGAYARLIDGGDVLRPRPAKGNLGAGLRSLKAS
jgi:hypothetical protein